MKRQCKAQSAKGNGECIKYKEALALMQPNYDLEDPLSADWVVRKGAASGYPGDNLSRMGSRAGDKFDIVSEMTHADAAHLKQFITPKQPAVKLQTLKDKPVVQAESNNAGLIKIRTIP